MLQKKSSHAELDNYSRLFFQLGLVLTLSLVYIGLEWKTFERSIDNLNGVIFQMEEIEDIPITERKLEIKPPPPPPPAPEQILIVANEEEIEETIIETTETDESEAVEFDDNIENIEEVVEEEIVENDIPFAIIEEPPVFPGCTGTKTQKKKCLSEKITEHVNKHYNVELATDLGLAAGKKRVYVIFRIDKNGKITNIKARGPHKRLEKEGIRVVGLLPDMKPGYQRGRAVPVSYTLPITLIVQM